MSISMQHPSPLQASRWVLLPLGVMLGCAPKDTVSSSQTPPIIDEDTAHATDTALPTDTASPKPKDTCAPGRNPGSTTQQPTFNWDTMNSTEMVDGLVDEAAFQPVAGAGDALHSFTGTLQLVPLEEQRTIHHAEPWISDSMQRDPIPTFGSEYVQCGNTLSPVTRGQQHTDNPSWDVLLGPGMIWSNPTDNGSSRIALPFALVATTFNCAHNGSMTFLYDGETVSDIRYQISQETCHLFQFDAWGRAEAQWNPTPTVDVTEQQQHLLDELDALLPVADFDDLAVKHPDIDFAQLDTGLTLSELTARGMVVDNTLYLDACRTRAGQYAFCNNMIMPSFSLAKTLYAGVGLAAMAEEFEEDPFSKTFGETLDAPGTWADVTVEHALDMATGHYLYNNQNDWDVPGFYTSLELQGRLNATFALPQQDKPGERVTYLTPYYQAIAAAMDVYLVEQGADITDSFDYFVDRVLIPAGVSADSHDSLRTWEDGGANNGTAFGGYGMWLTPQNIAKLGLFLQRGGDGILDADAHAEMMFATSDWGAPMNYYAYRYNNGMWAWPVDGCEKMSPILFGVSGITVHLPPNGHVYFAFNDRQEYTVTNVLSVSAQMASMCEPEQ